MPPFPARRAFYGALVLTLTGLAACTAPADPGPRSTPWATNTTSPGGDVTSPPSAPGPTGTAHPDGPDDDGSTKDDVDTAVTSDPSEPSDPEQQDRLDEYGVSAGHPVAAEAGTQMLQQGGNAVDAAVAAAFADAVAQPATSGIGGGGAALVLTDDGVQSYDYREVVGVDGTIPADDVGAPGFVAGLARMHQDHGSLPWADLLAPAQLAAQEGVPVSGFLATTLSLPGGLSATGDLPHFRRPDGSPLGEDDTLVQETLAQTLAVLAQEGPDALYTGSLAGSLVAVPGIDAETMADFPVQVLPAASGPVGDHTLVSAAPALPGAVLVQLAQVAEAAGIGEVDPYSPDFVDLVSRAWGVAEESAQTVLGDPAFVDVPVDRLTDPAVNAALAEEVLALGPGGAPLAAGGTTYEGSGNTTHISVVDADGGAVSMTNTITYFWGSGRYVDGYFLNNHLERFGGIGTTEANVPAPGRRSVSWSAPTMVLDGQGRPVLVLGTPGGQQIPTTTASAVLRWSLHGEELADLVTAPRFFRFGDQLLLETPDLADEMQVMGYSVQVLEASRRSEFGSLQALEVDWERGGLTSVADERRSAGFSIVRKGG